MQSNERKRIAFKEVLLMIWIFIKATVIPKFAYRFRNMYLFLPIILLIISWVLIPIPIQSYVKENGRSEFINRDINKMGSFSNLSDDEFEKLKALNLSFDLKVMKANDEAVDTKETILVEGNNKWYVVVDLCELDQVKNPTAHYDFVNFFDTYENSVGENYLLVLYNSKYLVRTSKTSNYFEYTIDTIDLNNCSKEDFSLFLIDGMVDVTVNTYGWYAALYSLIIPLAVSLFSFIVLKSNGRLKKFKNYLNVCGIASILPTLLVFIFSWIFPKLSLIQFYAPIYIAYFFFFISVINFKKNIE